MSDGAPSWMPGIGIVKAEGDAAAGAPDEFGAAMTAAGVMGGAGGP